MTDYITQEESEKYKEQLKQRKRHRLPLFIGALIFVPLAALTPPPFSTVAALALVAIMAFSFAGFINLQYYRTCPRCNGKLLAYSNVCRSCGANMYKVGKPSDGSEWLQ